MPPRSAPEPRPPEPHRSFLKRLPVALVVAMVAWLLLRPALDWVVSSLAELLVRAFEYPRVTTLVASQHAAQVLRADFRPGSRIPTIPLTEIHFNTIVLLALFGSLRQALSRRHLERTVMAWSVLVVTQALNLVFHVKCLYAFSLGEWSQAHYTDAARNVFGFLRYFTDLPGRFSFPFLLWLAFGWDRISLMVGARVEDHPTATRRKRSSS